MSKIDFFRFSRPTRSRHEVVGLEEFVNSDGVVVSVESQLILSSLRPLEEHYANDLAVALELDWKANRPSFLAPGDHISSDLCLSIACLFVSQMMADPPGVIYNELELLQMAVLDAKVYRAGVEMLAHGPGEDPGKAGAGLRPDTRQSSATNPIPTL